MKTSRRIFLKGSAAALAGSAFLPKSLFAAALPKEMVGIQLYSVRKDMEKDPVGTLKQLADMGYVYVEHANYVDRKFYGQSASEFRKTLDGLGLKMPSGHTVMGKTHWDEGKKQFTDTWNHLVDDAATVGQQFVISPSLNPELRKTEDDLKHMMDVFNKAGETCKKAGMRFGYHNHDFEFSEKFGNNTLYDIMLKNTDPELVIQQLDIGNLYNGGAKAIDIVAKYPGRFPSMHVKDEIPNTEKDSHDKYESTILGQGIVGTKAVIDLGRKSGGTFHFIIEQESYQGKAPLATAKEDLAIMKKWGY